MKRMPFVRPTDHYDERVSPIDEQICALLQERKELSDNNPGYEMFHPRQLQRGQRGTCD